MGVKIKPIPLEPGGTIGIVAPAGPLDADTLYKGEDFLKSLGYNVIIAPSCFEGSGYLAGKSDYQRAEDIMTMFSDDEVDAVFSMRGGYGCNRAVPYFRDFKFSKYPKPFIGYSDITYLHIYLNQKHNLITYHGPMIKDLLEEDETTIGHVFNTIMGNTEFDIVDVPYFDEKLPSISGELVGGNLSIICSTLGTPYEIDTRDKILFIEEVNEEVYAVDRMLMQLLYAGKLHEAKGVIFGDFNVYEREANDALLKKLLTPLKKPIAYNIPSGHCRPLITLPLGAQVTLIPVENKILFERF